MKSVRKNLKNFFADENGQATTEYVMLLAVLAGIVLVLGTAFRKRLQALLQGTVGNKIANQFFNSGAIHRFPIRIPD